MDRNFYTELADQCFNDIAPDRDKCKKILSASQTDLLPLLDSAFEVRKKFTGHSVKVHVINNAQNGECWEYRPDKRA